MIEVHFAISRAFREGSLPVGALKGANCRNSLEAKEGVGFVK